MICFRPRSSQDDDVTVASAETGDRTLDCIVVDVLLTLSNSQSVISGQLYTKL